MPLFYWHASLIYLFRGVAAVNKVRGQICPCTVGNRSSTCAIGLIVCVNMCALVYEVGGLCPHYSKSGGPLHPLPPLPPLLLPFCFCSGDSRCYMIASWSFYYSKISVCIKGRVMVSHNGCTVSYYTHEYFIANPLYFNN